MTRSDSMSGVWPSPNVCHPGIVPEFGDMLPGLCPKLSPSTMYCACTVEAAKAHQAAVTRLRADMCIVRTSCRLCIVYSEVVRGGATMRFQIRQRGSLKTAGCFFLFEAASNN